MPLFDSGLARPLIAREHHATLVTCDLVNEAWMAFYRRGDVKLEDRFHFYGLIARLMRQILIQRSRKRSSAKRGGTDQPVPLNEVTVALADGKHVSVDALEDAMAELERIDPRKARIIELRFYVGLNQDECAAALNISPKTIQRDWRVAKQWLRKKLNPT